MENKEFEMLLESISEKQVQIPVDFSEQDYFEILLDELLCTKINRFSLYLRLSKEKFIKIVEKGQAIDTGQLERLRSKKVQYVYMAREDFCKYAFASTQLQKTIIESRLPNEEKAEFIRHTAQILLQYNFERMITPEIYTTISTGLAKHLNLLLSNQSFFLHLNKLLQNNSKLYGHSLAVTVIMKAIALELKWTSPKTFALIFEAGIFHDIGLARIPKEILEQNLEFLNEKEQQLLRMHPKNGAAMLRRLKIVPEACLQATLYHHELCNGAGYPEGIARSKIHPVAKLIAIADYYCHHYQPTSWNSSVIKGQSEDHHQVFAQLQADQVGNFDRDFVDALGRVLKVKSKASNRK
ncbi:MAG: HD domain-containing protein [Bdellovibrio sp.]|nr:HD domain-containing protein [Bdellovibrio sp.]